MPAQRPNSDQPASSEDEAFRRALSEEEKRDHAEEERVHATYKELGVVGEKRGEQAFKEAVARGELTRGEREMAHGEFGPKAYEEPKENVTPANNP